MDGSRQVVGSSSIASQIAPRVRMDALDVFAAIGRTLQIRVLDLVKADPLLQLAPKLEQNLLHGQVAGRATAEADLIVLAFARLCGLDQPQCRALRVVKSVV